MLADARPADSHGRRDAGVVCLDARRKGLATLVALAPSMKRTALVTLDAKLAELPSAALCETDAAGLVLRDVPAAAQQQVAALETKLAELDPLHFLARAHVDHRQRMP